MRYLPQTHNARAQMLKAIGVKNVDDFYVDIPAIAMVDGLVDLPNHKGELEVERELGSMAAKNVAATDAPFFLGAGTYNHHIPASVDHIIQRSEFLTAYTPYQPEIAQGTLQAIFEYQTFIAQLTGQDVANASLYDGSTALAEAALMAMRVTKRKKIVLGTKLHPHYEDVLKSYIGNIDDGDIVEGNENNIDENSACVIVQSPDFYGCPHKYETWRNKCNKVGSLLVVVTNEIISLGMLEAPSQADIVCGEAQSIGMAMSYGGPHLGFFACKQKFLRQMPGRLCGMTEDSDGRRGFVLTLSTREQHIRREKATSNICTNQGLCALAFTIHMSLLGEDGFKHLARLNHEIACRLAGALNEIDGVNVVNEHFFNEFVIDLPKSATVVVEDLATCGIIGGLALEGNRMLVAATEMTTQSDIDELVNILSEIL